MPNYYLAVDGGGTKTEVLCADEHGAVIGRGYSGATSLGSTTVGAASFNLREAVRQATETLVQGEYSVKHLVMGLAGMDTQREQDLAGPLFQNVLADYQIEKFSLINDSWIALANGSDKPDALVLIAGTGSICIGKNTQGTQVKVGGMDYLLSDQGSGYEIGRKVLRASVKSFDGRIKSSLLEELVCKHFSISSIGELKEQVYNPVLNKIQVAELAPLCSHACEMGDEAALNIMSHEVDELVNMAETVIRKLNFTTSFDFVLSGSVAKITFIDQKLTERLRQTFPQINIIIPQQSPVFGALKLALSNT